MGLLETNKCNATIFIHGKVRTMAFSDLVFVFLSRAICL